MAAIPSLPLLFQLSPSRDEFKVSADNGKLVSEICKALIGVDCRNHDAYGMPTQATFEAEDLTWAVYLEFCFGSECINYATNLISLISLLLVQQAKGLVSDDKWIVQANGQVASTGTE